MKTIVSVITLTTLLTQICVPSAFASTPTTRMESDIQSLVERAAPLIQEALDRHVFNVKHPEAFFFKYLEKGLNEFTAALNQATDAEIATQFRATLATMPQDVAAQAQTLLSPAEIVAQFADRAVEMRLGVAKELASIKQANPQVNPVETYLQKSLQRFLNRNADGWEQLLIALPLYPSVFAIHALFPMWAWAWPIAMGAIIGIALGYLIYAYVCPAFVRYILASRPEDVASIQERHPYWGEAQALWDYDVEKVQSAFKQVREKVQQLKIRMQLTSESDRAVRAPSFTAEIADLTAQRKALVRAADKLAMSYQVSYLDLLDLSRMLESWNIPTK